MSENIAGAKLQKTHSDFLQMEVNITVSWFDAKRIGDSLQFVQNHSYAIRRHDALCDSSSLSLIYCNSHVLMS